MDEKGIDPSLLPSASYRDDPSEKIDTIEDLIRERIYAFDAELPTTLVGFRMVVEKIYLSAISQSTNHISVEKPLPNMLKVPYPNEFGRQYHKFWGTLWTHPILGKRQICTLVRLAYDYVKGLL